MRALLALSFDRKDSTRQYIPRLLRRCSDNFCVMKRAGHIGRTARRGGNDDADRPSWIGLGCRNSREDCQCSTSTCKGQELSSSEFHGVLLSSQATDATTGRDWCSAVLWAFPSGRDFSSTPIVLIRGIPYSF